MQECGTGKPKCARGTRCNKKTGRCASVAATKRKSRAAAAAAAQCSVKNRNHISPQQKTTTFIPTGKMSLKYRSCFSSVCESGYGISAVKSGLQKYLRRREREKMKWCAFEIYKFKFGATNATEKKIAKGIITNLANRFIVMLDEELIFIEVARYLYIREQLLPRIVAEETTETEGRALLSMVCDLLCDGRLLRLNSDINAYFGLRVVKDRVSLDEYKLPDTYFHKINYLGREGDSVAFISNMRHFIGWFKNKDPRCYYWMFEIYNMGEGHTARRYNRREAAYGLWEFLEPMTARFERAGRLFQYRLHSFFEKEKKERKMFLITTVNMCMYMDEIDWSEEIAPPAAAAGGIPAHLILDDYCIDMHCAEGRKCGKSKATFAIEGSLVVNEYQKYKVAEWREYYVREKTGDEPPARATTPILARSRSPSPAAAVAAAAAADTELEDVIEQIKHLEIAPPKKKIIIKKREAAADVIEPLEIAPLKKKIIIKKHAPAPAREPALEFIPIADLSMERLCGNTTCGGKAMCFIASYRGATYVFKEGRKSMGYNKDYVAVDECKTAFGLNRIGMKRIISDHILEKIDKTQKYWADNWKMTPREGVVYTMMNYIDGERLIDVWKRRGAAPDEIREFMKIGIWRGIFGVSDFSTINTWVRKSDGALFSIDEHGMLGSRRDIIGEKNRKIYTANAHFLPEIWADLYHDREKKAAVLRATLEKYDFPRETVDAVLNRYENLREMVDL